MNGVRSEQMKVTARRVYVVDEWGRGELGAPEMREDCPVKGVCRREQAEGRGVRVRVTAEGDGRREFRTH